MTLNLLYAVVYVYIFGRYINISQVDMMLLLFQRVSKLLHGDCLYRSNRCLFPWASLFIWAVLQNRSEMATFFWEMVKLISLAILWYVLVKNSL